MAKESEREARREFESVDQHVSALRKELFDLLFGRGAMRHVCEVTQDSFVEAGALMSVGADYSKAGQQAGRIAQQVLKREARPEDFAAVPAASSIVTINAEVARRLGIEFPRHLRREVLLPP